MNFHIAQKINERRNEIEGWLANLEKRYPSPFYLSTDIRDSGFKSAVVDVNLFPAGFNNLDANAFNYAALFADLFIKKKFPGTKKILLVVEENTRNGYYLENVRVIANLLQANNYKVVITTAYPMEEAGDSFHLTTSNGKEIQIFQPHYIINKIKNNSTTIDLIILNNDLIKGIPQHWVELNIPIIPSFEGGWHSRRKSTHFQFINEMVADFADLLQVDPWLLSGIFEPAYTVDINKEEDRRRLFEIAERVFHTTKEKYLEYEIKRPPAIFLKADYGTYGMGIVTLDDPREILDLNRKKKNKLYVGKGSVPVMCYMVQEGIPTFYNVENQIAEPCIYFVGGSYVGIFFRKHSEKGDLDNLNSKGAEFSPVEVTNEPHGKSNFVTQANMELYVILTKIASFASIRELQQLEQGIKNELCIPR